MLNWDDKFGNKIFQKTRLDLVNMTGLYYNIDD